MQAGRLAMELTAAALAERGLSLHEYAALAVIQRFGGTSQGGVGERLGLSKTVLSDIAMALEDRDLVTRTQDPWRPGRRSLYVTRTGLELLAGLKYELAAIDARFRKRVDEASLQALAELPARDVSPIELALRYCQ
jgi:DNA-binding MarR family transcriptional regulator